MKGVERWQDPASRRVALIVGFLLAILIIAGVIWVIATYPRDRRQPPPQPPLPGAVPAVVG